MLEGMEMSEHLDPPVRQTDCFSESLDADTKGVIYRRLELVHDLHRRLEKEPSGPCLIYGDDEAVRVFSLGTSARVGRSEPCELRLVDQHLSKEHFAVKKTDGAFVLSDVDSKNGTFVNGNKVSLYTLTSGDVIRAGNSQLVFLDDDTDLTELNSLTECQDESKGP
jgi:hypothetical protein